MKIILIFLSFLSFVFADITSELEKKDLKELVELNLQIEKKMVDKSMDFKKMSVMRNYFLKYKSENSFTDEEMKMVNFNINLQNFKIKAIENEIRSLNENNLIVKKTIKEKSKEKEVKEYK